MVKRAVHYFKTVDDKILELRILKRNLELHSENMTSDFKFTKETWEELIVTLHQVCIKRWSDFELCEVGESSGDYWEYYDKALDSNGYMIIKPCEFVLDRPVYNNTKLYQFKKRTAATCLYDMINKGM